MGFSATFARKLWKIKEINDLEYALQTINQTKMFITQQTLQGMESMPQGMMDGTNNDARTQSALALVEQNHKRLAAVESVLDQRVAYLDKQHKAAQTELEALDKVIDKNIERTFGAMKG
jgi:hypothetical protein